MQYRPDQWPPASPRADRRRTSVAAVVAGAAGVLAALTACGSSSAPVVAGQTAVPTTTSLGSTATPSTVATESSPPGDIPDNQAYVAYISAADGFSVKVPEGWARTGNDPNIAFADKLNSVHVDASAVPAAPTAGSVRATLVPQLQATIAKFQLIGISTVVRPAGTVVLVSYFADSATDPVTNKVVRDVVERYLFWHAGRLVVLTLTGARGSDNVDPWRKITDSLTWTR